MPPLRQQNGIFEDRAFLRPTEGQVLSTSILVVGNSTAAYTAALVTARAGLDVFLVQPTKIVGGQFTTQALPASDDGDLLRQKETPFQVDGERFSISRFQKQFRDRQRQLQPVQGKIVANPGGGWVSPLCTTPVVSAIAMNEAIAPFLEKGNLKFIPESEPIDVVMADTPEGRKRVTGVIFRDTERGRTFTVNARVTIEATDLGDLLELGNIESRVGQESFEQTGEQALKNFPQPRMRCQQSFTYGVLVERAAPGKNVPIKAPIGYDKDPWLKAKEFKETFWTKNGEKWEDQPRAFFHPYGIFRYRRLLRVSEVDKTISPGDVTVLNWGQHQDGEGGPICCGNDYRSGILVGVSREERQRHLKQARDRSRAFVHYLQSNGADLKPRGDLTWTSDGIALMPYIREARRGIALTTIRHEDVAKSFYGKQARAKSFLDSVGIGQYHYLDLHGNDEEGHVSPKGEDVISLPFTLPVGSLVPINVDGLVLSSKSIGTTHIANAAYRMHPIEWAIGEASGYLAALSIWAKIEPRSIATSESQTRKLQSLMTRNGIPIFWFDDIAHDDPDFEAIQVLAAAGIVRSESNSDLHFRPEGTVSRAGVVAALVNLLGLEKISPATSTFQDVPSHHWAFSVVETLAAQKMIAGVRTGVFAPSQLITREQLGFLVKRAMPSAYAKAFDRTPLDKQFLTRRELSRVLYEVLKAKLGLG